MAFRIGRKQSSASLNAGVVVVTAALFVGIATFVALTTGNMMQAEAERTVSSVVETTVGQIDQLMVGVESVVKNSTWLIREHRDNPDYMGTIARELVANNPFIVGSTICFEPDTFKAKGKGRIFAPYCYQKSDGSIVCKQLGVETDPYREEWYAKAKKRGEPCWSEPYFDEGGAKIDMSTYSVPIKDDRGRVVAVLTADVSIADLKRHVAALRPYPNSYAILFSAAGNAIVSKPESIDERKRDSFTKSAKAGNGWNVELVCPLGTILKDTRKLVTRIILFSLAGLGFIFFVSWSFSSRLQRMTAANERIRSELAIASTIQASILNKTFPARLNANLRPAKEIGGDLYDFGVFDGKLYFAVGDASGKGVPAALFSFRASAGFRLGAEMNLSPTEIVARINDMLAAENDTSMFVTLFVGVLDPATGRLEYCNAGHNPLVVVSPDGKAEYLNVRRNIAAGVVAGYSYKAQVAELQAGTRLIVYTDGVTEATRGDLALYGEERLLAFAHAHAGDTAAELVKHLFADVDRFVAGAEQSDDITIMAVVA